MILLLNICRPCLLYHMVYYIHQKTCTREEFRRNHHVCIMSYAYMFIGCARLSPTVYEYDRQHYVGTSIQWTQYRLWFSCARMYHSGLYIHIYLFDFRSLGESNFANLLAPIFILYVYEYDVIKSTRYVEEISNITNEMFLYAGQARTLLLQTQKERISSSI